MSESPTDPQASGAVRGDATGYVYRYEGTRWALYQRGPERHNNNEYVLTFLGTYRTRKLAEQALKIRLSATAAARAARIAAK